MKTIKAHGLITVVALTSASLLSTSSQAAAPVKSAAQAASTTISKADKDRLSQEFEKTTKMKATGIEPSPIPGIYEVIAGINVFYIDKTGKWLFDGHLVELATKTSVTAQRKVALEKTVLPQLDWRSLNLNDAIKTFRGNAVPGRVLVTFEDPNCGFCKRLHPELEKLQNVTVYTFPIAILGPESQAKNEALWCTKDRAGAWADVMAGKPVKAEAACDLGALARNGELSRKLMVSGTPTLFLADGTRIPGFMDAASIEQKLQTQQK